MVQSGIDQRFILPASPWWGGFYERLVRSVKLSLRKVLGRSLLSYEELQTILCEIELVINNRPLAYQSDDDINRTLTPWHLLHGRNNNNLIKSAGIPVEVETSKDASKQFQYANIYCKTKNEDKRNLVVGEIVIIRIRDDEPLPGHRWKMGLAVGRAGAVRGAKLKSHQIKDVTRQLIDLRKNLCHLELQINNKHLFRPPHLHRLHRLHTSRTEEPEPALETHDRHIGVRSTRKAAIEGNHFSIFLSFYWFIFFS